ncbi:MAG: serine/threonine-protein kinase [Myxococcota bacterium]
MAELFGRYELLRKLATGGMADIFVARQWGDGGFARQAIIKRLHDHLAEQPTVLADFRNEARLLSLLDHPSVPHIYDFRCEEGRWYLAMELLRGPTFGTVRRRAKDGVTPWQTGIAIALGLLEALCFVHERADDYTGEALDIVHGDLSPENVLLGRDGDIKVLDFGIASDNSYRNKLRARPAGIRGTNGYIAPETLSDRDSVDGRSDLFVAAILIYELTTGQRLYPGNGMEFMNALRERDPVPPSDSIADYPKDLETLLLRLLSRDPAGRPSSAREVHGELVELAHRHDVESGPHVISEYAEKILPLNHDPAIPPAEPPSELVMIDIPEVVAALPDPWAEPANELTDAEHQDILGDLDLFAPDSFEDATDPRGAALYEDELAELDALDVIVDDDSDLVDDSELESPQTGIKARQREDSTNPFPLHTRTADDEA